MDSLIGQTLDGRYLVESLIGEGAMGSVYKARHIAMAQPVAIKFLLTDRVNEPSMVERFIREARQSFHIHHPNCVRVTDFCATDDGTLFIVMDYMDGRTVGREIAVDGPISSPRVRHIAAQAADALHHAHGLGLVHRDLKPENMMLMQRGADCDYTKVFDFGLAKLFDQGMMLTGLSMSPLTQDGIVFGTPVYMAPEQALGGDLGPPSDIYTLGVCCYEMLTAKVPFDGATFTAVLSMHVQREPEPPSAIRPDLAIDPELEALVMRCLRKDASERPGAEELAIALRGGGATPEATTSQAHAGSETLVLDSGEIPNIPTTASVSNEALIFQRPKYHYALLALPLLAILVLVLFARSGGSDEAAKEASSSDPSESPALGAKATEPGARATATNGAKVETGDAGPVVAEAVTPDAQAPQNGSGVPALKNKPRPRPNPRLAAAEAAYRAKKYVKQLVEANAALRFEPKNRRAAFLAGDALIKSGDKVRACRFFKRSSRKHYLANGCEN